MHFFDPSVEPVRLPLEPQRIYPWNLTVTITNFQTKTLKSSAPCNFKKQRLDMPQHIDTKSLCHPDFNHHRPRNRSRACLVRLFCLKPSVWSDWVLQSVRKKSSITNLSVTISPMFQADSSYLLINASLPLPHVPFYLENTETEHWHWQGRYVFRSCLSSLCWPCNRH